MSDLYITSPLCPLYLQPSSDSGRADEALYGTRVTVNESQGDFLLVTTDYRYSGYVHKSNVGTLSYDNKMAVDHLFCDVLSSPSIKSNLLLTLPRGSAVNVIEVCDGWCKISLPDSFGYIREKYLAPYISTPVNDEQLLRQNVIACAKKYLSVQYRWGGRGPWGIDCSGLCSSAYLQNGVIIYRDAKIVEGFAVHPIEYSSLKPADLIYSPGHIMMYIGEGKMIHSSCSRHGVVIDDVISEEKTSACGSIFC